VGLRLGKGGVGVALLVAVCPWLECLGEVGVEWRGGEVVVGK